MPIKNVINPTAFPTGREFNIGTKEYICETGMTLRDWFAGQSINVASDYANKVNPKLLAKFAYEIADAMLAQRMINEENEK